VVLIALSLGCAETELPPGEQVSPQPTVQGDPQAIPRPSNTPNETEEDRYVLTVWLHLTSIEVPIGTVSSSEEIWSYLDEESIRQVRSPSIGLNGIRIGRGGKGTWNDVARILQRMTGRRLQESTMRALPGKPVSIALKTDQPAQTIFVFNDDRTFCGEDYPPGDNLLTIVPTLDADDPSKVLVTGVPQIRTSRLKTKFVESAGGLLMVNRPTVHSLSAMTFQIAVPSNDFLVIGPGSESRRPSSAGNRFLVKVRNGIEFETVVVIRFEVLAGPVIRSELPTAPEQSELTHVRAAVISHAFGKR